MRINDIINEMTSAGAIATVAAPMTKKPIKRPGIKAKKKDAKIQIGKGIYESDDGVNDSGMIGEPDAYYDAEERKEAYNQLQDALDSANSREHDYVVDGICPECGGSSYMDGDYEGEEDSCYGWGNYGCDEGEMEGALWKEIKDSDERRKEKEFLKNQPQPSDDELELAMQQLHKEYVQSGRVNAFELPNLLRQMFPEISKPKAREVGAKFLKSFNESISELKKLAGIKEGIRPEKPSKSSQELIAMGYKPDSDKVQRAKEYEDWVDDQRAKGKDVDEGKSPHKKGSAKYKKHMAAMHAGS